MEAAGGGEGFAAAEARLTDVGAGASAIRGRGWRDVAYATGSAGLAGAGSVVVTPGATAMWVGAEDGPAAEALAIAAGVVDETVEGAEAAAG